MITPEPPDPRNLPEGARIVGGRVLYPDMNGELHNSPQEAINSNQRVESDYSRGASGGCGQDSLNIPPRGDYGG